MVAKLAATLAIDAGDVIGEGPIWDAARERLLWSDVERGVIHEAMPDNPGWRETRRWDVNRGIGAALPRKAGGLIVAGGAEIFVLDESGGATSFAQLDFDPKLVRFNDAKCDPQGRLWAGTIAVDFTPGRAALYRIDPDGRVTTVLNDVTISNGLDWSPDGKIFYYVDSFNLTVDAFDFDPAGGTISNRRTIVTLERGEGGPDGLTVDRDGYIWVAVVGSGEVRRYSPSGALETRVGVPVPLVTSCAFGGPECEDLLITSIGHLPPDPALEKLDQGLASKMSDSPGPGAGGVFVCRPGPKGMPATPFAG